MGEGRDHRYVLLGAGSSQVEDTGGLPLQRIFSHLYDSFRRHPDAAFVGFFLNYDFTQWLKHLPEQRAWFLFSEKGTALRQRRVNPAAGPFPVSWEGWEFDILASKRFKLRPAANDGPKAKWMYINDAGPFFQASLMSVIDPRKWDVPVVSEEEYAILEEGKRNRSAAVLDNDMRMYNRLENDVLVRLMSRLDQGLRAAGIRLRKDQWFGPGQAAQAWLILAGIPTGDMVRKAIPSHGSMRIQPDPMGGIPVADTDVLTAARESYYGGWFEIFAHGHIPGRSYEYDINSAYPHVASRLPCLLHGTWSRVGKNLRVTRRDSLYLVHARILGSNPRIGGMLHRRPDGTILRPHNTGGWYWYDELNASFEAGLIEEIDVDEGWIYDPCDCEHPLRALARLYDRRLSVGKNTPEGKALKLVYNSVYGKFAQSLGSPKFGNSLYASLITSGCRAMILDAIASHPGGSRACLMVATDGVYFTSPHPGLDISPALGKWEESVHENLTLFKPGVYWDDKARARIAAGEGAAFKARGINAQAFATEITGVDRHFARWPMVFPGERDPDGAREGWYPRVTFKSGFSMTTCVQALQFGKWELAGRVVSDRELVQDADPVGKRHSGYFQDGIYWSRPFKDGGPEVWSTPYDKRFGQPDPDEYGINEDGAVKDQWGDLMR